IDGSGGVSLNLKGGGSLNPSTHETVDKKMHYIYQDGPAVYKFAVRKMAEATTKVLERSGVTGADLGCFIPHQANKRIITATSDRLGMDPERVIINIEKYGNTSAGKIPLAMETAIEEGKMKKGDHGIRPWTPRLPVTCQPRCALRSGSSRPRGSRPWA